MAETDIKSINKRAIHDTKAREEIDILREQYKEIANKTVVENGKIYLVRADGTKIDTGTTLPIGSGFDESKFMYITEEVDETIACTDITLSDTKLSFTGSGNKTITATLTPSNTTDVLTYTSSNKSIATVNNEGVVTAVGNGNCIITATCGDISKTCNISVSGISTTVAVTGVKLDKSTASVNVGETITLVETVEPSNATNQNVVWSSDAENIAKVENGVVTGIAEGTASIGVATEEGRFSATCNVTVKEVITSNYKNIFDKDTMLADPAKGLNSTGLYKEIYSSWKACEIPVKPNTVYSIKKCSETGLNKYNGGQNGNFGFLNSNKELISSLNLTERSRITESYLAQYPQAVAIEDYSDTGTTTVNWIILTTPKDCAYLVFNTNLNVTPDTVQVEEGNTIHDYYLAYRAE